MSGSAPVAQARSTTCRVPNVVGLSAQAARAAIHAAGCTGTIFRTTVCIAANSKFVPFIGRVREQHPAAGTEIASRKSVEITVGITGSVCKKLNPPKQAAGFGSLDGSWTGTFTVQQSSNPLAKPGQKLAGIAFTVKDGVLGGNLSGTISSAGYPDPNGTGVTKYDANVTANMLGASCNGVVSFWIYDGTGQAASTAGITCGSVVGLFTATQNP
jgi:hypothetical protein